MPTETQQEATATCEKLKRVQLIIGSRDSAWLDDLAHEIRTQTGARVSRSEIVRAAIGALQEIHRNPPAEDWFTPLSACKSGAELSQMALLAVRAAQ